MPLNDRAIIRKSVFCDSSSYVFGPGLNIGLCPVVVLISLFVSQSVCECPVCVNQLRIISVLCRSGKRDYTTEGHPGEGSGVPKRSLSVDNEYLIR